jgi:hypothetical protein
MSSPSTIGATAVPGLHRGFFVTLQMAIVQDRA